MTRRRQNIGRRSVETQNRINSRANETNEQHENRLTNCRDRQARSRSAHSSAEQRATNRFRMEQHRQIARRQNQRIRNQEARQINLNNINLHRVAFQYNPVLEYSMLKSVNIGTMNTICQYCHALKFKFETPGMCCAGGKVKLPILNPPPEPLNSLLSGETPESKHFLKNIQTYNSSFQMTSFGADKIVRDNYMPTFKVIDSNGLSNNNIQIHDLFDFNKIPFFDTSVYSFQIQGQIYHRVGSLLPLPEQNHKFLQIYFVLNTETEIDLRYAITHNIRRGIIIQLQEFFHEHNELVRLFRTSLERMMSDSHKIVIRPDKTPVGMHARRYNAPSVDEVIVIVGDNFEKRDIVLHRRNNQLQRVAETHRFYDALQCPILFWSGEEG